MLRTLSANRPGTVAADNKVAIAHSIGFSLFRCRRKSITGEAVPQCLAAHRVVGSTAAFTSANDEMLLHFLTLAFAFPMSVVAYFSYA